MESTSLTKTSETKSSKLGRPCLTPIDALEETLKKFKHRLFREGKTISKRDEVWEEISRVLQDGQDQQIKIRKSPAALYTYVTCNKNGVLKVLQDDHVDRSLQNKSDRRIIGCDQ